MAPSQDSVQLTADNIRALAHPLRVQILGQLRTHGPATASGLAARLGLSTGSLSYHLRQLERFGLIVEDTERGDNRDRWWRAAHRYTEFHSDDLDPALAEVGEEYERSVIAALGTSLSRAYADRPGWTPVWQRTFDMSDTLLQLTAAETEQLSADLLAVLRRYRQHVPGEPIPEGTEIVSGRFQVYPVRSDSA